MVKRLNSFYEKFKILHESQHGFRKNRSTTLAIYKYIQEIITEINNKKYAVGLLLDLSKAYDRVSYETLLNKLYSTGIRGTPLNWFKSYFETRSQYTEIESTDFETGIVRHFRSDRVPVNGSIPQGSVLGCILFLVYINDLPDILNEHCTLFADDISVLFPCVKIDEVEIKLNLILDNILNWLEIHNLELNIKKAKIIQFKPYQKTTLPINYSYNNLKLENVTSASLLGIELDTSLTFKHHIQKLTKQLSSFVYALNHLKRLTDLTSALSAYYAYAYSRMSYGLVLWGNSTDIKNIYITKKVR